MKSILTFATSAFCAIFPWFLSGQVTQPDTLPRGAWAYMEVANGDTTFLMSLRAVRVAERRGYKDSLERVQLIKYRIAARKVYPYALQAVDLYNEVQDETADMSKRKRKRYLRHEHHELKEEFTDKMKNLTRTQGKVLIKMMEREIGKPFYDIIKETRGGVTATYWHTLGKLYDYDLKEGYQIGSDPLLDEVLLDYDFDPVGMVH